MRKVVYTDKSGQELEIDVLNKTITLCGDYESGLPDYTFNLEDLNDTWDLMLLMKDLQDINKLLKIELKDGLSLIKQSK